MNILYILLIRATSIFIKNDSFSVLLRFLKVGELCPHCSFLIHHIGSICISYPELSYPLAVGSREDNTSPALGFMQFKKEALVQRKRQIKLCIFGLHPQCTISENDV